MTKLFDPLTLRGVTLRNRIGVSPMCMYSSIDGMPNAWHLVHYGSRAVGGAGLVITEATAVSPEGRITPSDLGLWNDAQLESHRMIASFIESQGAVAGIQLSHAGRKASRVPPWETDPSQTQGRPYLESEGGWKPSGPSDMEFASGYAVPAEMSHDEIAGVIEEFVLATRRAVDAGYSWIEVHAAHGYLLHSFASRISNKRTDEYGGSLEARCRFTREVARAVRRAMPCDKVLGFRLSYTDWAPGGWTLEETVQLAKWLEQDGVDIIDVSSGGNVPNPAVISKPGYQVPGAEAIRQQVGIPTAAVGWIDNAEQAGAIVSEGKADVVLLGREMLRDPYWPLRAALQQSDSERTRLAVQYSSAWAHLGSFSFDPISAPKLTASGLERIEMAKHTKLVGLSPSQLPFVHRENYLPATTFEAASIHHNAVHPKIPTEITRCE